MSFGALAVGNRNISCFLHPVVDEPVGVVEPLDQFVSRRFPKDSMDMVLRGCENGRKHRGLGVISETGELPQCGLRFRRQLTELGDHQLDHVLRVFLGADVIEKLAAKDVLGGVPCSRLAPDNPDLRDLIVVASTEVNTDEDRAAYAQALKEVLA